MNERGGAPPGGGRRTRARARRRDARAPPRRAAAARPRARASSECERYRVEVSRRARSLRSLPPSETCVSRAPREKQTSGGREAARAGRQSLALRSIDPDPGVDRTPRSLDRRGVGERTRPDRCDLFERRWRGDERSATRGRDSSKATFATRAAFFSLPPRATSPRAADGARLRRGSVPTARTPISRFPIRGGAPHTPRARRVPRGSAAGSDLARPCARRVLRVRPLAPRRVLRVRCPRSRRARRRARAPPKTDVGRARFLNATAFAARV